MRASLKDRWLWAAVVLAVVLRVLPLVLFPEVECTRDECIYRHMARAIVAGEGLVEAKKGWLAAPFYPYALAFSLEWLGNVRRIAWLQILVTIPMIWTLYRLGVRLSGGVRAGRIAAFGMALHPTFVFFSGTMWTETFYTFFLLASLLSMLWAREGRAWRGLVLGLFIALSMLLRGAATFLIPFFCLGLIWPDEERFVEGLRKRWGHCLMLGLAAVLLVAPYSKYASDRNGGFLITDATLGHVMFLGNNTFDPITFDYGNGMLTAQLYSTHLRTGRAPCKRVGVLAVPSSNCEVGRAMLQVKARPLQFVRRIPLRLAQLLNPNSFFTRHLRWGYWPGLPWVLKEFLVASVIATSATIVLGGTLVALVRNGGAFSVAAVGLVAYHVGTIALLYGMTRFRLPLEGIGLLYVALGVADPRALWRSMGERRVRTGIALVLMAAMTYLMSWYLLTGYPGFWR